MRIIGRPTAQRAAVLAAVRAEPNAHHRFADEMFDPLWNAALAHVIDPLGVIAQAFHETGGGRYDGQVPAEFFNTCGLKIRRPGVVPGTEGDLVLAHAQFANWRAGATAHAQHLRAYAGYPVVDALIVDPRYEWVIGRAELDTFEELGGRWAPSPTYGQGVVALAERLRQVG